VAARRGRGEGSIYKRPDGLWAASIELPPLEYNPDGTPKRRRKIVSSKQKATVIRRLTELRRDLERSGDLHTDSLTVEAWCDYWVREIGVKTRRPKTMDSYRSILDQWVKPTIGRTRLDKLTPATIRKVLARMEGDGKSSTYRRNAHSVMAAVFADAEREGRIPRNPVELVIAPTKAVTNLQALDPEETARLLTAFGDSQDTLLWATFILTGARRGEVLGLEWDRVTDELDLSWQLQRLGLVHGCGEKRGGWPCGKTHPRSCPDRRINVPDGFEHRQVHGALYWTRPKSRAGWRVIPLVDPLAAYLARWRDTAPSNPWGLVFTRPDANGALLPVDPDYASRWWPEVLRLAGIEKDLRLHDLRHTAVDLLLAAGVSEELVSEIVGHSTVTMTRAYKSRGNRERLIAGLKQLSSSLGY